MGIGSAVGDCNPTNNGLSHKEMCCDDTRCEGFRKERLVY